MLQGDGTVQPDRPDRPDRSDRPVRSDRSDRPVRSDWVRFSVTADDGYRLGARRLTPPDPVDRIVIASATGVPQGFYRRFAERAAGRGYEVITFDYRGIGDSAPRDLRGFRMDYRDWGRLDLAAVVRRVGGDGRGVLLVGHSFGGMALGLLPEPEAVRAAYLFGTGTGWPGFMPRLERVRVAVMWNVLGPIVSRACGYVPWRRLGMGEDLPVDLYRQWRSWSGRRRFWFDDPQIGPEMRDRYARVTVPIVAATSVDDRWIPPASRDAFFAFYRNADLVRVDLDPAAHGLKSLGHMGYFRGGAEGIWDRVLTRFDELRAVGTR